MQAIGKYEVVGEIGSGSMGTIYEARDPMLDRAVALKVLRNCAELDPELKERFYREARACARLSHPNIIAVYDLGESGDSLFIAMELLSGSDLRKLMKENRRPALAAQLDIMAQVCDALEHAHSQQLVHRDIKPSNIFVCTDNRAKVLDFGIAKLPTSNLTIAGKVLGSPNYMSPEQIRTGKCDTRSDLFSAAIVFYEFMAGAHPFQNEFIPRRIVSDPPDSLRQKNPQLPEALELLLSRALEKDPDKRIQTAGEFAAGLRAIRMAVKSSPSSPVAVAVEPAAEAPAAKASPFETAPSLTIPQAVPTVVPPATTSPRLESTAEQRVSEFLRIVGDFDEGIDKRDVQAARAALDRMRQLSAVDSRFVVAVSDCETRLNGLTPSKGIPVAPAAFNTGPAKLPELTQPVAPAQPTQTIPPPAPAVTASTGKSNKGVLAIAAAAVFLLIVAGAVVMMRKSGPAEKPVQAVIPAAAPVATVVVTPATADLLQTPNASGKRLAVLHHGETLNVVALPGAREQEFTNVRTMDNPLTGYVRTTDISDWSATNPEAAFSLATLFGAPDTGSEAELNAKLELWNGFIGRFPSSSHLPEANLNAARIEFALGKLVRSAGKPAAEWQPHLARAKEALASVTGAPALATQIAELQKQMGEHEAQSPSGPASVPADRILRGRVSSLWEAGQYQEAMAIVDQILAQSPTNQEALTWKSKIRAAQDAEASAK